MASSPPRYQYVQPVAVAPRAFVSSPAAPVTLRPSAPPYSPLSPVKVEANSSSEEDQEGCLLRDQASQVTVGVNFRRFSLAKCLMGCCGCCCLLLLALIIGLLLAGRAQVKMSKGNAQDPSWTPVMFPRYSSCGGCAAGYKSDAELEQCIEPCYNVTLIKAWEAFSEKNGFKMVYFPSRPGPAGEPPVNVSAWWLPAPGPPGPRIVAMHGLASNNNHCGVQMTCFLLRELGFSCLAPSARDFGFSGASTHPDILTWGYDYQYDLLGAWDYAIGDPDGLLGGPMPDDKVGVIGFSKGALTSAIAMGLEPRLHAAWLDSAPFHGLRESIYDVVKAYTGRFIAKKIVAPVVFWGAQIFSGNKVDRFDPIKLLSRQCGSKLRYVFLTQSSVDDVVSIQEFQDVVTLLSGMPSCYNVRTYTPPEYCNGAMHHQEMWEYPDDTRKELCHFWSRAFDRDPALCKLGELPSFQIWSPEKKRPPGSPGLTDE